MSGLSKTVEKKVKEYAQRSQAKRDKDLMRKIETVLREVKRVLDFTTWFDKKTEEPELGPLDFMSVFPEVLNVPAFSTRRVHVRAYDREGNVLREKDNVEFGWRVTNDLGTVIRKGAGEAIFKAGSKVGAASLEARVRDLRTDKTLTAEMEIAITHPVGPSGKLARVWIDPTFSKLPLDSEKEYRAFAEDKDRIPILKGVEYEWSIPYDESGGAKLNIDYGESVVLSPGRNPGTIKLQATAYWNGLSETDFAVITVVERKGRPGRPRKPKGLHLPTIDWYDAPNEVPLKHSYLSKDGTRIRINEGHPDYKIASMQGKSERIRNMQRRRYIVNLYAKELTEKECEETGSTDFGEKMLDVLCKIDRFW
jgi:hypothetical protein